VLKNNIRGLNQVLRNLNNEVKKIKGRTLKGLIRGGLIVLRDVELTTPLTPVELGNLRASRFLVTSNRGVSMGRNPTFRNSKKNKKAAQSMGRNHHDVLSETKALAKATGQPTVILGFSAKYAAPVHEKRNVKKWSRPGSGRKFFEMALDRNVKNILKVIRKEAKIK